jgi:hypothetical protein
MDIFFLKVITMSEDEFSGEKSVVREEPTAADYERHVRIFRSFAAIGVVFATAGVVSLPFGLLRFHQGAIAGDMRVNMMDQALHGTSWEALWLCFSSLAGAGLATLLLAGAVGALRLRSWSFVVLWLWAIASIILGVAGSVFYLSWLLPPWREQWAEVRGVVIPLVNLGGWMIGSALAVVMIIMLSNSSVKAALHRNGKIIAHPLASSAQDFR